LSGLRILVVDDSDMARLHAERMVSQLGHQPVSVASGEEALAVLERETFDLVLCDLVMPGMDGLELLQLVRSRGWEVPFILMTAHATVESAVEALRAGADDYLPRPLDVQLLAHRLESVIQRRQLQESREQQKQLEAVLATAGAAAHEMNQPLTTLLASAEFIARVEEPARIKALAATIAEQARRLGQVTRQLAQVVRYQTKPYLDGREILDLEASSRKEDKSSPE